MPAATPAPSLSGPANPKLTMPWRLTRMTGRDRSESRRSATPLELFFDLVFVVAVSFASDGLYDLQSDGLAPSGFITYAMVFFAIWWAWMNFTWFATAFDTDDWLYRLTTVVQMAGALVLAAGAELAILHRDFTVVTIGYVIMTFAIVAQWVRAGIQAPEFRTACFRHAAGAAIVQVAWVVRLALPEDVGLIVFFVLVAAELAVPVISDHSIWTPSNPQHVAERYGLFTLIVLGESVLSAARALITAIDHADDTGPLLVTAGCGLVIVAAMWWLYFAAPFVEGFKSFAASFVYGYVHYFLFAAAGAVSAGIATVADARAQALLHADPARAVTLTLPVAIFCIAVWALATRRTLTIAGNIIVLVSFTTVIAATFLPLAELWTAAALTVVVVCLIATTQPAVSSTAATRTAA